MTLKRRRGGCALGAFLALAAQPGLARAETLADAIAQAYRTNPTLQSQRAQLRGLDESYVTAAAGLRPTINTTLSTGYEYFHAGKAKAQSNRFFDPTTSAITESNGGGLRVTLDQPLFTGGRVSAQIDSALANIRAGRELLRAAEGDLLLSTIDAYTSVLRDQAGFVVRQTSLAAFQHQLDEAQARRGAGEVTLSDVAQAQAQVENERALLAQAQQQLNASRLDYATLVGANPASLEEPPPLPAVPPTVDQAFELAEADNPELKQAIAAEKASRDQIRVARSAGRPSVNAEVTYGYSGVVDPFIGKNFDRDLTAQAVLTQPLYTGGQVSSGIRRALEQNNSDRANIETVRRRVVQSVGNAWNLMLTSQMNVATQQRQVTAARTQLDGMQAEYRAGLRSTFDVLYAEQTLRNAEILLLQARHDAYLGEAEVLRYIGALEVTRLTQGVAAYDPGVNLQRARHEAALPWDPLVQTFDRLGSPGVGQRGLREPAPAVAPTLVTAASDDRTTAPPATTLPLAALPGTTADQATPAASPARK